jgi:hypothetical protein
VPGRLPPDAQPPEGLADRLDRGARGAHPFRGHTPATGPGAVLGWGNMWGNVAAALSPVVLGLVKRSHGWDAVLVVCAATLAIAGAVGVLLTATRPVSHESGGA